MSEQIIKLEIVATGKKLNSDNSLLVLIDPQYANYLEAIHESLKRVTGHSRHTVIPVPKDSIQVFSISHPITVSQQINLIN